MSATRDTPWSECLLEPNSDPELVRNLGPVGRRRVRGLLYFHPAPWLMDGLWKLQQRLTTRVHLEDQLADLVGLVVSQDNSCRYCFAAQRAILRILGFSEGRIVQLEHDLMLSDLDSPVKVALDYARRISRSSPLPDREDVERLRAAGFADAAIRELASHVALHIVFNRMSTLAALPPEGWEALPDSWWARGFRPLLAPLARMQFRRADAVPLRDAERAGPYAFVVVSLDGLPLAPELRSTLDAMWRSPILTHRCKAFLFGVVARALGCLRSEAESLDLLAGEGVAQDAARRAFDHLSSASFTPQESVLIPFARETVWYQTPRLQERARAVRDRMTRPEFVEALGVLSIANAVCRLDAALAGMR